MAATISEWGTTIWIEVISQCQNTGECNEAKAHWWKFEKSLTYTEAFWFVISHKNPSSPEDIKVGGTPVELKYMEWSPANEMRSKGVQESIIMVEVVYVTDNVQLEI